MALHILDSNPSDDYLNPGIKPCFEHNLDELKKMYDPTQGRDNVKSILDSDPYKNIIAMGVRVFPLMEAFYDVKCDEPLEFFKTNLFGFMISKISRGKFNFDLHSNVNDTDSGLIGKLLTNHIKDWLVENKGGYFSAPAPRLTELVIPDDKDEASKIFQSLETNHLLLSSHAYGTFRGWISSAGIYGMNVDEESHNPRRIEFCSLSSTNLIIDSRMGIYAGSGRSFDAKYEVRLYKYPEVEKTVDY
ncbi:hypothetical protein HOK68_03515 [Candidatus Woesearchaeota archaeon]|jgi:hypothetical protein|nr:hypothetical protein [Candidatus Woesearchaeota archaeon]MBT4387565.1 hypothetical protein [Candidatus Woesearchaeota archaeon]MBT4595407.1 hypothetical protein [Candidatus Woesearchaeota archaeon]MBT5741188.1 hypothetical protein [Candidatus Woesearchaeota archaeon]MBT6505822.1 hypothetical protein [Candidatus Woesearchaeota archaeon]